MRLKYLFTAYYNDRTTYSQNPEDTSLWVPGKSAFYDAITVINPISGQVHKDDNGNDVSRLQNIVAFILRSTEGVRYGVDLTNGIFDDNGEARCFYQGEVVNRRLIYFRRCEVHLNKQYEEFRGEMMTDEERGQAEIVSYFIGWQGNDPETGANIQRTLEIEHNPTLYNFPGELANGRP